jgi:hypothetical protein
MSLLEICQWLQATETGTAIRESIWVFPIIEGAHVLSLGLSVGMILWFDLRILGFNMRNQPISRVYAQLKPWMFAGFTLMFISGFLLFWAHAESSYLNLFFRIKVAALTLSAANILYFHFKTERGIDEWDKAPVPPLRVRLAGLFSILLWAAIMAAGRLMASSL